MIQQSLKALHRQLINREISSVELTQEYLERINKFIYLNAYINVDSSVALNNAKKADKNIHSGKITPLTGIPMAHKDIFCTTEMPTTCGSKMLANYTSPYAATVVTKLESAGAVMLGKTNMDEFAMGSTNENSYFGAVKNPWDITRVPGGSSGGSAATVAAGLAAYTTGTDTGGSIRQPASFCGISGIKPTYGLVSRYGMVAYASSLDQGGPMARSAEDLAIVLQEMIGTDSKDSTSLTTQEIPSYINEISKPIDKIRIGLPECFFNEKTDKSINKAIMDAVAIYEKAGAEIIPVNVALHNFWTPCYYVIASAEASSNLERYDGVRFGHRSKHAENLQELISNSRSEGFGIEVKRRILTGTYVLSSGYYDAYYLQAQKIRRMISEELRDILNRVDVIIGPTTPTCAFKIGEKITNPTERYLADIFTVAANLAGLPAASIPAGFNAGLPIGMQLIGNHFSEARILQLAHFYQQQTDWHLRTPKELEEKP